MRAVAHLVILLAASCGRASQQAPAADGCKVDTDDQVSAAMQLFTGKAFIVGEDLVRHPAHFPKLAVIGRYVTDGGDTWTNEAWGPRCALVGFGDAGVQAEALRAAGWATADPAARGKLALAWLAEVEQVVVLTELPPEIAQSAPAAKQRFAPPITKVLPDGGIELSFWSVEVRHPYGSPMSTYPFVDVTFAPDGSQRGGATADTLVPPPKL